MKKIVLMFVLLAGIASTPAIAKPYISGSVGLGMPGDWDEVEHHEKFDSSAAWNGAIGYSFGSYRLEAALGYENPNYKNDSSADASILTVMANGYYDIDTNSKITPYLMAGAGIADINVSWWTANSSTSFVWQVGAGVGLKGNDHVTFDLGYRYIRPEGLECPEDHSNVSWSSHHIMAGVRYQF